MTRDQINIRCGMDLKKVLIDMDNYSEFCRDAILDKIQRESSKEYLQQERKKHEEAIKKIDQDMKHADEGKAGAKEFLEYWLNVFKSHDRIHTEDHQNLFWIRSKIIPEAKGRGFKLDEKHVLEMFKAGRVDVTD